MANLTFAFRNMHLMFENLAHAETEQALRDFEYAHGLPPATEITERLVKQLTAAARAGGR